MALSQNNHTRFGRWLRRQLALFVEIAGQPVSQIPEPVSVANLVSEYLLNAGSNDMGIDGSVTPVEFSFEPPRPFRLHALVIYLEAATAFDTEKFANLPALTNGVELAFDGAPGVTWRSNIEMMMDATIVARIGEIFNKKDRGVAPIFSAESLTGGRPLLINSSFSMVINDDLSQAGLIFLAKVQGVLEDA